MLAGVTPRMWWSIILLIDSSPSTPCEGWTYCPLWLSRAMEPAWVSKLSLEVAFLIFRAKHLPWEFGVVTAACISLRYWVEAVGVGWGPPPRCLVSGNRGLRFRGLCTQASRMQVSEKATWAPQPGWALCQWKDFPWDNSLTLLEKM